MTDMVRVEEAAASFFWSLLEKRYLKPPLINIKRKMITGANATDLLKLLVGVKYVPIKLIIKQKTTNKAMFLIGKTISFLYQLKSVPHL